MRIISATANAAVRHFQKKNGRPQEDVFPDGFPEVKLLLIREEPRIIVHFSEYDTFEAPLSQLAATFANNVPKTAAAQIGRELEILGATIRRAATGEKDPELGPEGAN